MGTPETFSSFVRATRYRDDKLAAEMGWEDWEPSGACIFHLAVYTIPFDHPHRVYSGTLPLPLQFNPSLQRT